MKKVAVIFVLVFCLSLVSAVWWNPFSWFEPRLSPGQELLYDNQINVTFDMVATGGNAYYYETMTIGYYEIKPGDVLMYDVYWTSEDDFIAIDYSTIDRTTLRGSETKDQNEIMAHPGLGDLSSHALNTWYHREFELRGSHAGKTIEKFDFACESDNGGRKTAYFRNIKIVNKNTGEERNFLPDGSRLNHAKHIGTAGSSLDSVGWVDILDELEVEFDMASTSGNDYYYEQITSVNDCQIQPGDVLMYDVYWTSEDDFIAIDYTTNEGSTLRSHTRTFDQNGIRAHPGLGDLSSRALNTWYHREIELPGSHAHEGILKFDIACESDNGGERTAYFSNIKIVDGEGNVKLEVEGEIEHAKHMGTAGSSLGSIGWEGEGNGEISLEISVSTTKDVFSVGEQITLTSGTADMRISEQSISANVIEGDMSRVVIEKEDVDLGENNLFDERRNIYSSPVQTSIDSGEMIYSSAQNNFRERPNFKGYIIQFDEEPILKRKVELERKQKEIEEYIEKSFVLNPVRWYKQIFSRVDVGKELKEHQLGVYAEHLELKNKIKQKLGIKELKTLGEYKLAFNGISLDVSTQEAREIEKISGVKKVSPNYQVETMLMDSVPLIGADQVWEVNYDEKFDLNDDGMIDSNDHKIVLDAILGRGCNSMSGRSCDLNGDGSVDASDIQMISNIISGVTSLGYTGEGITIAIIDTGVDYTHEDLGGCFGEGCKVVGGYDFVNDDSDPLDDHGHGTHVASTAAGDGVLKGVAPGADIWAFKVLNSGGSGWSDDIIAAIERSYDLNGDGFVYGVDSQETDSEDIVDVISMSLGGPGNPDDSMSQAIDNAVDAGVVAVIAAGNSGPSEQTIGSPGTARKAITVGASDKYDNIAGFSSRGPVIWEDEEGNEKAIIKPDVVAPGFDICAAQWENAWNEYECIDNEHTAISGTSMATPHVAGAVALLKQKNPDWTPEEIKSSLKETAVDIGESVITQGYGRIDVLGAVGLERPMIAEIETSEEVSGIFDIIGTAKGEGFERYEVYYSLKDSDDWNLICEDDEIVEGDVLCEDFDSGILIDGEYEIKLVVYGSGERLSEGYGIFEIDLIYINEPMNNDIYRAGDSIDLIGNIEGDIENYVVEFSGDEGLTWSENGITLVNGGTEQIIDDVFATWDTSGLEEGFYDLRLIVNYAFGGIAEESIQNIYLDPILKEGWPIRLDFNFDSHNEGIGVWPGELAPQFYDVDNDGEKEILFLERTDNKAYLGEKIGEIHAFETSGLEVDGWPIEIISEESYIGWLFDSPITIADINGDNKEEILILLYASSSKVIIYGYNFAGEREYELVIEDCNINPVSLVVFDLDNDLNKEIILKCSDNFVIVKDLEQIKIPLLPSTKGSGFGSTPAIGQFDDDVEYEIVVVDPQSSRTRVGIYNHDGGVLGGWPKEYGNDYAWGSPVVGDIDNDGEHEIIVGGFGGLFVINRDGSLKWMKEGNYWTRITLSDLNSDGKIEIITTMSFGYLRIFNWDGSDYLNWDGSQRGYFSSVTKDIDGEGIKEVFSLDYGEVFGYKNDGTLIDEFPLPISRGTYHSNILQIEDIDNDGRIEIAASIDWSLNEDLSGELYLWEIEGFGEESDWPQFQHDPQHTGCYDCQETQTPATTNPPSRIENNGEEDLIVEITMKIQAKIRGEWRDYLDVYDGHHLIRAGETKELSLIWNGEDVRMSSGTRDYRVYVSAETDEPKGFVEGSWEFDVV